jgi:N-acetylglucosamine-6-sulfatase
MAAARCVNSKDETDLTIGVLQSLIRILQILAIVMGLAACSVSQLAVGQSACKRIRRACINAGFAQGGLKSGNGLWQDCIDPILKGSAQRRKASKQLPQLDPQLVAACKQQDPNFGNPKRHSDQANESVSSTPSASTTPPWTPDRTSSTGPNIVFILTDDLAMNLLQFMPHVLDMEKDGVTFSNYFVTDSLCCPSRSSIFTGRFPHNTGIFRNQGADGGYIAFRDRGHEQTTFAIALSAAGYRTAMMGKYLNGYKPELHSPAPGWTLWSVAGNGYPEFRYSLSEDGKVVRYGTEPKDYLTDVLSDKAVRFIKQGGPQPFLIEIATFTPHMPYVPAPRDANAFPDLRAPRTPAFNAAPEANSPKWLIKHPALTEADITAIDIAFRKRAQSVLAVDKMIGELQAAVAAIGQQKNTYFVFSSDNGYHMGEYRLMPGKMTAFDTDIHVPLVITGPGVSAGLTVDNVVENVDVCPTFTDLAHASSPPEVDGRSLVPFMRGQPVADARTAILVEHHGPRHEPEDPDAPAPRSGNPPSYEAIRTRTQLYVEYADGEREYHDLVADPDELQNTFSSLSPEKKASLSAAIAAIQNCHGTESCGASQRPKLDPANAR